MRIAISGSTGFLGSSLAGYFLTRGFEVVGIKRESSNKSRIKEFENNPKFTLVNSGDLEAVFQMPIDAVIHTATNYGREGESVEAIEEANVELPFNLLKQTQKNGVGAFINTDTFMSTETPPDDRHFNYVATKKKFLEKAKAIIPSASAKFINMVVYHMYGPNDNPEKFLAVMARRLAENEPEIKLTLGQQKRDFIYISDVLEAFGAAVDRLKEFSQFEEFNIGTGQSHSVREAVESLRGVLGSSSLLKWGALESRQHDEVYGAADISGNSKLGWKAKVGFDEGLKKTGSFYKKI